MQPRIEHLPGKKFIGQRMVLSLAEDRTGELWRSFMPRRKEIPNVAGTALYSLQAYPPSYFDSFDAATEFTKWAAVEVSDFGTVPPEMEAFPLPDGLYAVFLHRGPASEGARTFRYIFGVWLPASEFVLDNRHHFELLGEKYKNEDPGSEEEIWIPVKHKDDLS